MNNGHLIIKIISITTWMVILPLFSHAQTIRTIAGTGSYTSSFGPPFPGEHGPAIHADLGCSFGVCTDTSGNVYYTDQSFYIIRKIDHSGIISTIAGTGFPGYTGEGGPATAARIGAVQPIVKDKTGNLYFGDVSKHVIQKISPAGIITRFAGDPSAVYGSGDNGPAMNAGLGAVSGLAFDATGNLYLCDANAKVRKINTAGIITTFAGTGALGYGGDGGPATSAIFTGIVDITFDNAGNMYLTDQGNAVIRKINTAGLVSHFAGTFNVNGFGGDGGAATSARLRAPQAVRCDSAGNVYIADAGNNRVRKVNSSGIISTFAGFVGAGFSGDGGPPASARLSAPTGLCFDRSGNMYIGDKGNCLGGGQPWGRRIRQIFKTDTFHISVSPGNVLCGNTFAAFTAHIQNAYYSHILQWRRNGIIVGGNSPTYSSPSINNNDTITCAVIDTANGSMLLAVSDTIVMTVLPPILPVLSVTSTGDTVCQGLPITFTATAINGGTSPIFMWYVFGIPMATGHLFTYIPSPGDIVTCELTSSDPCAYPNTAHVDIPLSIIPSFLPVVIVTPTDTVISHWSQIVTFFTNLTYGGVSPAYQWYSSSGPITGATSSSYYQEVYAPDTFYCVVHSDAFCAVPAIDTSNFVYISTGTLYTGDFNKSAHNFLIYPNPNTGQFIIRDPGIFTGANIDIEIRDVLGRILFKDTVHYPGPAGIPVSLHSQPAPGNYLLVVGDDRGRQVIPFLKK